MLVMQWIKGDHTCSIFKLQPLLEEVRRLTRYFMPMYYIYMYRERHTNIDGMQKMSITMHICTWHITKAVQGQVPNTSILLSMNKCKDYIYF